MMRDKPRASPSVGIEVTPFELRGVVLTSKGRNISLNRSFSTPLDLNHTTPHHVKPLYMGEQEADLKSTLEKGLVVTGLSGKDLLIRNLDLQLTKERDINSVMEFQAEPLLPYPIEEGVIDWTTLAKEKERTLMTIAAVKNEVLAQHLEMWHSIDVEPEVVGAEPYALAAFSGLFLSAENTHIHIHLGYQGTTCVLVKRGKVAAAQSIRSGLKNWIEAVAIDWGLSFEETKEDLLAFDAAGYSEEKHPELSKALNKLTKDVTRVVYALVKQSGGAEVTELLASGEGANVAGLAQTVCKNLQMDVRLPEPIPGFTSASIEHIVKNVVPIGLALTGLPKGPDQVNFRQNEYSYPDPWKRTKQPMAVYLGLCLLAAISIYYFGLGYVAHREDQMREGYVNLLALMKKPYEVFEKEMAPPGAAITVESLSQSDIQQRLNILEKEIRATPDIFPLLPNTPKVSDVLAWLSTLPQVTGQNGEGTATPRLVLEGLAYKMVKRPESNKMREKYQVKVELEFTAATPRFAREFHDYLLTPNEMIDPTGDVKWSAERDRYRTSFFLKDRTIYPTSRR